MTQPFPDRLEKELPEWVKKKFITASGAEKALAFTRQTEADNEENAVSKFLPFLTIIGAVFVGLGFVLYFAANWDVMSDLSKFALLVLATLAVSVAAYLCLYAKDLPKTGHALALLGSILYGASIFLIGQTYNLG